MGEREFVGGGIIVREGEGAGKREEQARKQQNDYASFQYSRLV